MQMLRQLFLCICCFFYISWQSLLDLSSPYSVHRVNPYFCSLATIYQNNSINMDNNHTDDYVLVLEDCTDLIRLHL